METLSLGEIPIEVVQKDIKNVHLTVHPPDGRVRIAAPLRMELETIRAFAISRLGWIRKQRHAFQEQERETPRDYINRESHYLWGERYLLRVVKRDAAPTVKVSGKTMTLYIRPGMDTDARGEILAQFYRDEIRAAATPLIERWSQKLGVEIKGLYVQQMKTRWGSCNHKSRNIRLNTQLARKPKDCLEYIIVHELAHLQEPTHNERFQTLMDVHMPGWRDKRATLNSGMLGWEEW